MTWKKIVDSHKVPSDFVTGYREVPSQDVIVDCLRYHLRKSWTVLSYHLEKMWLVRYHLEKLAI